MLTSPSLDPHTRIRYTFSIISYLLFVLCNEEVFGGLTRSAETLTNQGGSPFIWVQQVKGEGLGWGEPKDTKRGTAFPVPHGSETGPGQSPTYLMLSPDLFAAELLHGGTTVSDLPGFS